MDASADHDTAKTFADDTTDAPSSSSATMITIAEHDTTTVTAYWLMSEALSIYLWWMTRGTIITAIPTASTIEITHESSDTTINEDATDAATSGATVAAPSGATNVAPSDGDENQAISQNWFQRWKPLFFVLVLKLVFAGMNFLTKLALNNGMSSLVFVFYRNLVASLIISPVAYYLERNRRPAMTFSIVWKIFVLSLLGPVFDQDLYFLGMKLASATFATAIGNLAPAMTFVLALFLGREKIHITMREGQAKVLGTLAAVAGAMIMALIKGPILISGNNHHHHGNGAITLAGAVLIAIGCMSTACFAILQSITLDSYDAPLSLTAYICILGTVEAWIVAVVGEKKYHSAPWTHLGWDLSTLSYVYAGIFCSAMGTYLSGVISNARGPVYSTTFNPLTMIIVSVTGILFLGEQMLLGSLIGMVVILLGLYSFLWGKKREIEKANEAENEAAAAGRNQNQNQV